MTDSIWIHYSRPRPNWYMLDEEERTVLVGRWDEVRRAANGSGASTQGRFHIRGQHDFEEVEIWRFPTTLAAFEHWSALCGARYNEYFAFSNNVGLEAAHDRPPA